MRKYLLNLKIMYMTNLMHNEQNKKQAQTDKKKILNNENYSRRKIAKRFNE